MSTGKRAYSKFAGMFGMLAFVGLALVGCASSGQIPVQVSSKSGHQYPATPYVSVLYSKPDRSYKVVAVLKARGAAGVSGEQVIGALTEKARRVGANAIIVSDQSAKGSPQLQFNSSGGDYKLSGGENVPVFSAIAIRWVKQ